MHTGALALPPDTAVLHAASPIDTAYVSYIYKHTYIHICIQTYICIYIYIYTSTYRLTSASPVGAAALAPDTAALHAASPIKTAYMTYI